MTEENGRSDNGHSTPKPGTKTTRSSNGKKPHNGEKRRPSFSRYAHITGWGMAVPERVLTNAELSRIVDTTDEWIVSHTGIKERRIAEGKETTTTLSIDAALRALEVADVLPEDVDLVIVATATPEHSFPSTACLVQDAIGAEHAAAFDVSAACTGFVTALGIATQAIRSGSAETAVVIGAETLSKVTNWQDRSTCILFADGAGAVVLQGSDMPGGILSYIMRSDGSGGDLLSLPSIGSNRPASLPAALDHTIDMNGREVFRFATRVIASITRDVVAAAGFTMEELDLIIPHQANRRIIEAAARGMQLPTEKFYMNLDKYGNTSAASIPIALCEAVAEGKVKKDDKLVFVGFGGGLTWGAVAAHWDASPPPEVSRWHHVGRQTRMALSRVRSFGRQALRRVEGVLFGSQAPDAVEPPRTKK
jgi:3-oxoacyl-[acyl-carrier-protein] synthase-3